MWMIPYPRLQGYVHQKTGLNRNQQIPSPLMGEG